MNKIRKTRLLNNQPHRHVDSFLKIFCNFLVKYDLSDLDNSENCIINTYSMAICHMKFITQNDVIIIGKLLYRASEWLCEVK